MMERVLLPDSNFIPRHGRILRTWRLTGTEKLFEIALDGSRSLDHEPGQFVMVSIPGVGEAPISVSSSPGIRTSFQLCVRAVGKLTQAMHLLEAGDDIGIRGPFGRGFPARILEGDDLLIVAGGLGIAPLRSLIRYILDNRREFGRVHILLGCRSPGDILFADEIDRWRTRVDVHYECIVDRATPEWEGQVGLITNLIPGVHLEPERTFAVICGPPVMYSHVIREVLAKGVPESQILISLERHMKCGMGKCGRCQIQGLYCCKDGPVFSYADVKSLPEAF